MLIADVAHRQAQLSGLSLKGISAASSSSGALVCRRRRSTHIVVNLIGAEAALMPAPLRHGPAACNQRDGSRHRKDKAP
ncbi:hypothetical protein [Rhizobium rhizosphaerae]|uniref:hypothetical protein n=1 Tax=Xaviernesmea rhizosphaerae TaxID=1672749 RepID=UPI0011799891|nr:hypothetical protein [Xaviernesmea rhizosphaerae]